MSDTANPPARDLGADLRTPEGQHKALSEILAAIRQNTAPMIVLPEGDDTAVLGVLIASYLNYLGSDILATARWALVASSMYGTADRVHAMQHEVESGLTS